LDIGTEAAGRGVKHLVQTGLKSGGRGKPCPHTSGEGSKKLWNFLRNANIDFPGEKVVFHRFFFAVQRGRSASIFFLARHPTGRGLPGRNLVYVKFAPDPDNAAIHEAMRKAGLPNARIQTYDAVSKNEC